VIDCTAIPESLFESILFGHARGAFTGAIKDQAGLLCQSDGGVAFFDEIGELNAASQAKLLRAIQEQTVTPVGMMQPVKFNARFICATNRNLELEVKAGRFRQDLYYRLAVIHLELPPLRQRGDDVLLLAQRFLQKFSGGQELTFADDALDALQRHAWPGNVRELRNAVERGAALATDGVVRLHDLPTALHAATNDDEESATSRGAIVGRADRDYLISLLEETHGNVARAARIAGLSRQGMHKLLKRHELEAAKYRATAERSGG
jgi:DNA-binding NtrC family response regulator